MHDEIKKYAQEVVKQSDIPLEQIPNIPLYMDQILMMMEQLLEDNKRNADDKIMTKTMINNYSKEKIIKSIKGKTYPKEQVLQILMIYRMKNTLTMQEMRQVMEYVYADEEYDETTFARCYQRLLQFKEKQRKELPEILGSLLEEQMVGSKEDDLVTLLCLCTMSEQMQKIANRLLDERILHKSKQE